MTGPLPQYKEGQVNRITKIIINQTPSNKPPGQENNQCPDFKPSKFSIHNTKDFF